LKHGQAVLDPARVDQEVCQRAFGLEFLHDDVAGALGSDAGGIAKISFSDVDTAQVPMGIGERLMQRQQLIVRRRAYPGRERQALGGGRFSAREVANVDADHRFTRKTVDQMIG
jgi:hypothetical protein